jgi:hypothetical protein
MFLFNPKPNNRGSLTALVGENSYFIFLFSNKLAMVMESNSL